MKKLIASLILFSGLGFGATGATAVWELRNAGADTNSGGFDSAISGAGTDLSIFDNKNASGCTSCQSTSVNISTTDAVTNNTTTVTSATGNFSSALIGNAINLSGTGTTTGWYWVTAVGSATSITVDRATGSTGGTGVTMNIGGALKTFSQAFTNVVAGNRIWAKGAATFSISSGLSWTTSCTNVAPCQLDGYTTTRGDGGQATIQASVGITTLFTDSGAFHFIRNLIIDVNSKAASSGVNITGSSIFIYASTIENFTVKGISLAANGVSFVGGLVQGGVSGCTAGINTQGRATVQFSRITGNACHGISTATTSGLVAIRNIIDGNTGASTDGISVAIAASSSAPQIIQGNDIYNNGRHGIFSSVANGLDSTQIIANIISKNATDGINSTTTVYPLTTADYNAFWNNGGDTGSTTTHNLVNFPQGSHDACAASCGVTISGDPYTSAGTTFTLNNTMGAGAALRASGFPGAMPSGGTGYLDIGALQHQDTGGSSVTPVTPIVQ
jgi:hypothetical protein